MRGWGPDGLGTGRRGEDAEGVDVGVAPGIKVLLDVVYNHTGEGSEMGPTVSFRGLYNLAYYSVTGPASAPARSYQLDDDGVADLTWFGPDQGEPRWSDPGARTLCYQLDASDDGAKLQSTGCSSSSTSTSSRGG